jgi:transcriptional regulator with XRE-family HTH domain
LLRGLRLCDLERATGIADTMLSALELGQEPLRGKRLDRLAAFYATPAAKLVDGMRRWAARAEGNLLPHDGSTIVPPGSAA